MRPLVWFAVVVSVAAHAYLFVADVGGVRRLATGEGILPTPREPVPVDVTFATKATPPPAANVPPEPAPADVARPAAAVAKDAATEVASNAASGYRAAGSPGAPSVHDGAGESESSPAAPPSVAAPPPPVPAAAATTAVPTPTAAAPIAVPTPDVAPPTAAPPAVASPAAAPSTPARAAPSSAAERGTRRRSGPDGLTLPASILAGEPAADLVIDPRSTDFVATAQQLGLLFLMFQDRPGGASFFLELGGPSLRDVDRHTSLDRTRFAERGRDLGGVRAFDVLRDEVANRYGLDAPRCRIVAAVPHEVEARFRTEERRALAVLGKTPRDVRALFGRLRATADAPLAVTHALLESGQLVSVDGE